jgi:hypothetical protein
MNFLDTLNHELDLPLFSGELSVEIADYSASSILVTGHDDGTITARNTHIQGGKELWRLKGHSARVTTIAISANGKFLASGDSQGYVKVWLIDEHGCSLYHTLEDHHNTIKSVAFSPDNLLVSLCYEDLSRYSALMTIHDVANNCSVVTSESTPPELPSNAVISMDGKMIARGSYNGVIILDTKSGSRVYSTDGHTEIVNAVAFSSDGTLFASGSDDNTINVWDLAKLEPDNEDEESVFEPNKEAMLLKLKDSKKPRDCSTSDSEGVSSIAFSSDRTLLASGNKNGNISVWNLSNLECTNIDQDVPIDLVAFSSDGILASINRLGHIEMWHNATMFNRLNDKCSTFAWMP